MHVQSREPIDYKTRWWSHRTLIERLFGTDVFISYAHASSAAYVTRLAQDLRDRRLAVFHDLAPDGFAGGAELTQETARVIRASSAMVLVFERRTFASKFVRDEIRQFLALRKLAICIDRDRSLRELRDSEPARAGLVTELDLADADRELLDHLCKLIAVDDPTPGTDSPTEAVVSKIVGSLHVVRRATLRIRVFTAIGLVGLALVITAGVLAMSWKKERLERDRSRVPNLLAEADAPWPSFPDPEATTREWLRETEEILGRRATHEQVMRDMPLESPERQRLQHFLGRLDELAIRVTEMRARQAELPAMVRAWNQCLPLISKHPSYAAAPLEEPVAGLVPLGEAARGPSAPARTDAASSRGLWEFYVPKTGTRPKEWGHSDDEPRAGDAVVLVLIPQGRQAIGDRDGARMNNIYAMSLRYEEVDLPHFIGKYEVTRGQWGRAVDRVVESGRADESTDTLPVTNISWHKADEWSKRVGGRLPTEQEWEVDCRAGASPAPWDLSAAILVECAWFRTPPSREGPFPVGKKASNPWGLHDMHGNAAEWCDSKLRVQAWRENPAAQNTLGDPDPPEMMEARVFRGGSYDHLPDDCGCSHRDGRSPDADADWLGFRLAWSIPAPSRLVPK